MKEEIFEVKRYDADEGKIFDYKKPKYKEFEDENGNIIKKQIHLYVTTLFIGLNDSIDNYIEIEGADINVLPK